MEADQAGDGLGEHGCRGGSGHAPAEDDDEEDVQGDIGDGGAAHGDERGAAVAEGAEDGPGEVIGHGDRHAAVDDRQVERGHVEDAVRRVQQAQRAAHREQGEEGEQRGDAGGELDGDGDGPAQALFVLGAEALGDEDGEALSCAADDAEDEPAEPVRRADGGEGFHPGEAPDDGRVGHRIELLEDVAQHQGQGEGDDVFVGLADGHVAHGSAHRFTSGG